MFSSVFLSLFVSVLYIASFKSGGKRDGQDVAFRRKDAEARAHRRLLQQVVLEVTMLAPGAPEIHGFEVILQLGQRWNASPRYFLNSSIRVSYIIRDNKIILASFGWAPSFHSTFKESTQKPGNDGDDISPRPLRGLLVPAPFVLHLLQATQVESFLFCILFHIKSATFRKVSSHVSHLFVEKLLVNQSYNKLGTARTSVTKSSR